jgi:polo-like kinase 1
VVLPPKPPARPARLTPKSKSGAVKLFFPEITVKKYVDYSDKYGTGYYLSNNAFGVFFNDDTKMVSLMGEEFKDKVCYYYKGTQVTATGKRIETQEIYDLNSFPTKMRKKCLLFKNFRSYLIQKHKI